MNMELPSKKEDFKVGDIVLADNDPYNPHSKNIPWAKGKITRIRVDAGGSLCYYLEGAYTYFWRVIPFEENTKKCYLETNNGDYDEFMRKLY